MRGKLQLILKPEFLKEKALVIGSVVLVVVLTLWILAREQPPGEQPQEFGVLIPKGFLVVPLELANANSLSSLIDRQGVVDLFMAGSHEPLAEGVRVLKLAAGEGPVFGALVPQKIAGTLQDVFSRPKIRAALRTQSSEAPRFHLPRVREPLLQEFSTGE